MGLDYESAIKGWGFERFPFETEVAWDRQPLCLLSITITAQKFEKRVFQTIPREGLHNASHGKR